MRAEIRRFFESYREAFNRLDAEAISRHFWVPSMITTRYGYSVWADVRDIRANMVTLCDRYRARGFVATAFEPGESIDQPPDHAVADLRWTVHRREGRTSVSFRTGYNVRRDAGEWRILL